MKKSKKLKEMSKEELEAEVKTARGMVYISMIFALGYFILSIILNTPPAEAAGITALLLIPLSIFIPAKNTAKTELRMREAIQDLRESLTEK